MSAQIIDGKVVAAGIERSIVQDLKDLAARGIRPKLVVVRVGHDPASEIYVRSKARKAGELGIESVERHLPEDVSENDLLAEINALNRDESVDGILVQLPLPGHIPSPRIIEAIAPQKDVDGFHPANVGRLQLGQLALVPCTPAGIVELIHSTGRPVEGMNAVVLGRSNIVGKPVAALLLRESATVTVCHSRTRNIGEVTRKADLVVAAIGRPFFVTGEMVKPDAIVIDVGINRIQESGVAHDLLRNDPAKLAKFEEKGTVVVGDVDFAAAREHAGWITPVPGGVGPMTIIMLMRNTIQAARERRT